VPAKSTRAYRQRRKGRLPSTTHMVVEKNRQRAQDTNLRRSDVEREHVPLAQSGFPAYQPTSTFSESRDGLHSSASHEPCPDSSFDNRMLERFTYE
jgi:hypothetical protein